MWRERASILLVALVALFLADPVVEGVGNVACGVTGYQLASGPGGVDLVPCHPVD